MATVSAKSQSRKSKTSKGEETRVRIIHAVLNIIRKDGVRGVRHRAVAEEADVPLGTTTYHFKNIEDLIVSAFSYWRETTDLASNPLVVNIGKYLQDNAPELNKTEAGRNQLATKLYHYVVEYEVDQMENRHDNRVIELAFYHESLRNLKLQQEVFAYWQNELDNLIGFYQLSQSPNPEADARITQSIFHQLEREAMMQGDKYDIDTIRNVLKRTITAIFNAQVIE